MDIDFASINNSEFTTLTITDEAAYYAQVRFWFAWMDLRVFNLNITNITQDCVMEIQIVSNIQENDQGATTTTTAYNQFVGGDERNLGVATYTTSNLSQGQDFSLGIIEYASNDFGISYTDEFKIMIKITPSA